MTARIALALSLVVSACADTPQTPGGFDAVEPSDTGAEPVSDVTAPDTGDDVGSEPPPSPCVRVMPSLLQFGGTLVGSEKTLPLAIHACGDQPLTVSKVSIHPDSHPSFSVEALDLPVEVAPGETLEVAVVHAPESEVEFDEQGQPILGVGRVVIASDAATPEIQVGLRALDIGLDIPLAVGAIEEDDQVPPQTVLHLSAAESTAPNGPIAHWEWSVEQPAGSVSVFHPNPNVESPTFEVNVAGTYVFDLEVTDQYGAKSAIPWTQTVAVVPDETIHVELLWRTPGDADESDEGPGLGSDLDLHFAHASYAVSGPDKDGDGEPDPWFDQPFDTFWFNAHPNWGSFDPVVDDDPSLDRDDTDGAGPENLNLDEPEDTPYLIGVHYWSDNGFGDSFATVRVYLYGQLAWEAADIQLSEHDMWMVAELDWATQTLTPVEAPGGAPFITPNY